MNGFMKQVKYYQLINNHKYDVSIIPFI